MKLIDRIKAMATGQVIPATEHDTTVQALQAQIDAYKAEMAEIEAYLATREDVIKQQDATIDASAAAKADADAAAAAAAAATAKAEADAKAIKDAVASAGLPAAAVPDLTPTTREAALAQLSQLKSVAERQKFFAAHSGVINPQ